MENVAFVLVMYLMVLFQGIVTDCEQAADGIFQLDNKVR